MGTDHWDPKKYPHAEITERIIGAAMKVHNALGPGFLEAVFQKALLHQLVKDGFVAQRERVYQVKYDDIFVGTYVADLVVEEIVIIETKAVSHFDPEIEARILNYLKVSGLRVALLINFGRARLEFRRFIL